MSFYFLPPFNIVGLFASCCAADASFRYFGGSLDLFSLDGWGMSNSS